MVMVSYLLLIGKMNNIRMSAFGSSKPDMQAEQCC